MPYRNLFFLKDLNMKTWDVTWRGKNLYPLASSLAITNLVRLSLLSCRPLGVHAREEQADVQAVKQTGQTSRQTAKHAGRQTGRQTSWQVGRQADSQSEMDCH